MSASLPLAGIRVLEFTQLIMGPTAGMILADLGADVVRIEPAPAGDPTRKLGGFLAGFSDYFNRNKRSVAVDLKHRDAPHVIAALVREADVLIENFSPGTMQRLGCGYDDLAPRNPRLVYCSLKGFLPGPYENRTALDEVVQFMGGLAYMTGPRGRPLRAGSSVVDLMGGTMGAVAILAALRERDTTGRGQLVQTGLFESVAFMMGQHMAAVAINGRDLPPMPEREGGWSIYELFETASGTPVFIAITSDALWQRFCAAFALDDLAEDASLATNADRVAARPRFLPRVVEALRALAADEVMARCEAARIPFSNVATTADLFTDRHLRESGTLVDIMLKSGVMGQLPGLPIRLSEHELGIRRQPPAIGEHTREVLSAAGCADATVDAWIVSGAIAAGSPR